MKLANIAKIRLINQKLVSELERAGHARGFFLVVGVDQNKCPGSIKNDRP